MHNKASYRVCSADYFLPLTFGQYYREDGAQAKKSYEDKYGAKVYWRSHCYHFLQGAKSSKGSKGSKSAAKEETYLDEDDLGADVKSEAKSSRGAKGSAKEVVWSKEEDYF